MEYLEMIESSMKKPSDFEERKFMIFQCLGRPIAWLMEPKKNITSLFFPHRRAYPIVIHKPFLVSVLHLNREVYNAIYLVKLP